MADNTTLNSGTGGDTIATDDIGGVKHQRVKIQHGDDGSATDASATNPLPVTAVNAGTFVVQVDGSALTSLQLIDDIVYVDDADWTALSSKHALTGGIYQSTPGTITDGDTGPFRITANGALHIADGGGSITVDNGGTFAVQADSVTPGTGATNLGKAVDAVAGGSDVGVAILAVRDDSLTTLTPADGDYVQLRVNSTGALHVTGGGGGTEYTEDDAAASNPIGGMNIAVRADSLSGVTSTDGDNIALRATNNGELYVKQTDAVPVTDNGGSLTVDGTVTANAGTGTFTVDNGGTFAVQAAIDELPAAAAASDNFANPTTTNIISMSMVWDGATWDRVPGNSADGMLVNLGSNNDVTVSNTVTVDLGSNNDIQGDVAHDSADSGNPVKIGAKAETSPKGVTLVADGDRTDLIADSDGIQVVKLNTTGTDLISERVSDTAGTSAAFTNFSAVASTYNYVTSIAIANTSSTDGYVDIRDGTAGSVLYTIPIPANGGATLSGGGMALFKSSANTALAYDVSAALTTVYISMSGYQSKA